jgi:hypothetical protein
MLQIMSIPNSKKLLRDRKNMYPLCITSEVRNANDNQWQCVKDWFQFTHETNAKNFLFTQILQSDYLKDRKNISMHVILAAEDQWHWVKETPSRLNLFYGEFVDMCDWMSTKRPGHWYD